MNKRNILEALNRSVLLDIAYKYDFSGLTAQKRNEIVDILMRMRIIKSKEILEVLRLVELKDLCKEFEISPKSWRKNDIIKALLKSEKKHKKEKRKKSKSKAERPVIKEKKLKKEKVRMPRNAGNKKPIEQYTHEKQERLNNPPVGLVTPETDKDLEKKQYQYDPHLDPQLFWTGKAEHTSFEVPTVSLHVHERIDPKRIIEQVQKKEKIEAVQTSMFETQERPLREAIEFYKHKDGWTNRLIAGDSLLVMNSLIEKEGMGEKVQMVFIDPPYGISYGSNFQPFVNKRDVKDGKDDDLTSEPEMLRAFRDTWELGIHSYLAYLRDRLLLARDLLAETGSIFVQISDENLHHVRELMDEVFGAKNFFMIIPFKTKIPLGTSGLAGICDYLVWYAKDKSKIKFRKLYKPRQMEENSEFVFVELPNGKRRKMTKEERANSSLLPENSRVFRRLDLSSTGKTLTCVFPFKYEGNTYNPTTGKSWKTNEKGMRRLAELKRLIVLGQKLYYTLFFDDYPVTEMANLWNDTAGGFTETKKYVVETNPVVVQRCMLMCTDPGDLVLDPTCGSGTTAYVAENWGRRWLTCDTSRVSTSLAKQRLMTAKYDYFALAHDTEGVSSGFKYREVPHVTLGQFAQDLTPGTEILYDQPIIDVKKSRITGPFTVEAVPAPTVKSFEDIENEDTGISDESVTRSGETLRQSEWRQELLKTGVRGKSGQYIKFSRIEPMSGTMYIQAEGEIKWSDEGANTVREQPSDWKPQKALICFGPEHAPLEQRTVEMAWQEARAFKPDILLFCAFQFDEEAAKDIDELPPNVAGMQLLKVQMNADLLTDDLRKKRSSNESFWLIGQPDVEIEEIKKGEHKGKYKTEVLGFDYYNTKTGNVEPGGKHQIAMWMLDTNYDGRSLFPSQVFFPMAGAKEGWSTLARNLKAEIDEEKIETFRGTESLPFESGDRKTVAVKIVDDRGIESLKIIRL